MGGRSAQRSLLAAVLLLALPRSAGAQEEQGLLPPAFSSDRPGFANSTAVAARDHLTAEAGISAAFDEAAPSGALPNLSLRVGVLQWLELRVRGPNAVGVFSSGGDRFGMGDPRVGFKLGGSVAESLALSSVWEATLPVGTDDFGASEAHFSADLTADWNFWGPLTLTPNAVAAVITDVDPMTLETVRVFEGVLSLKVSWQILDVLGVYVQSYALASERSPWRIQVGAGLMWMVTANVQVDASFDMGVTDASDPPSVAVGTTVLF